MDLSFDLYLQNMDNSASSKSNFLIDFNFWTIFDWKNLS